MVGEYQTTRTTDLTVEKKVGQIQRWKEQVEIFY